MKLQCPTTSVPTSGTFGGERISSIYCNASSLSDILRVHLFASNSGVGVSVERVELAKVTAPAASISKMTKGDIKALSKALRQDPDLRGMFRLVRDYQLKDEAIGAIEQAILAKRSSEPKSPIENPV